MRIAGGLAAVAVAAAMILAAAVTAPAARAASAPPGIWSHYAELANAATGANLWSRSSTAERPMGSVTKVMTAYVVLTTPGLNLNRVITVPGGITAYDAGGASTAGLRPGERLTARQLLFAMMLPSGCDAAYTLASAYGPGLTAFVARMNATARQLGLGRTHFTDPSGLPYPGPYSTYSTAHDLIALGIDAMRNKSFAAIVATRQYNVAAGTGHLGHAWKNLNPLLGQFPGAAGVKTGYTPAAGQCLLFAVKRGGTTLIGVVLDSSGYNSPTLAAAGTDAVMLLNWGLRR
jgi:D-alanyl-D-alanine carboxypeptidase (penicillin-binding protein 5/6)